MPEKQLTLKEFTLDSLRSQLDKARDVTIEKETLNFTPVSGSPPIFEHKWTFENISTLDEFNRERDETKKYARKRLRAFAKSATKKGGDWRKKYDEWEKEGLEAEPNDRIEEFLTYKENLPELESSMDRLDRVGDPLKDEAMRGASTITTTAENLPEAIEISSGTMNSVLESMERIRSPEVSEVKTRPTTMRMAGFTEDQIDKYRHIKSVEELGRLRGKLGFR